MHKDRSIESRYSSTGQCTRSVNIPSVTGPTTPIKILNRSLVSPTAFTKPSTPMRWTTIQIRIAVNAPVTLNRNEQLHYHRSYRKNPCYPPITTSKTSPIASKRRTKIAIVYHLPLSIHKILWIWVRLYRLGYWSNMKTMSKQKQRCKPMTQSPRIYSKHPAGGA